MSTEPNKQEFLSASKDANKQPPAEAGEGAEWYALLLPADNRILETFESKERAEQISSMTNRSRNAREQSIVVPLYTSQTTATQAAVAAAMRKCADYVDSCAATSSSPDGARFLTSLAQSLRNSIPAEATAALDAHAQEKCMEVARRFNDARDAQFRESDLRAIVRDVLNKPANGGGK